ncbi:peptidoglycan-binding protein [Pseudofrancisella aestuarii]|uniref:Peptidoglycan-binding protein n=1 Tax=Pseudofrancisella aestuarii TaxID=2670347 RepID=A0ABV9TCY2_9GAMM|nr:LysM domain-containing protein [Pseudofrancisella aestuarii]
MFDIVKKLICSVALVFLTSHYVFSMDIYTVQPNDYLYKIAANHSIKGVSNSELVDAIKGINKPEIPDILSNRIGVGDKIAIPTTKSEVEDGLILLRNQYSSDGSQSVANDTGSSVASNVNSVPEVIDDNLGDKSMIAQSSSSSTNSVQHNVPGVIFEDSKSVATKYGHDLENQIQGVESEIKTETSGFLGFLRIVVLLLFLGVAGFFGKKYLDSRNDKKEKELEIISKKRRDHLMSRISPVVSDVGFYRTDKNDAQAEFDFFGGGGESQQNTNNMPSANLNEEGYDEDSLPIDNYAEEVSSEVVYGEKDRNIAVRTDRGVIFETNENKSLTTDESTSSSGEEGYEDFKEQEQLYVIELVDQYLDSEKFVEASITLQDSLETDSNNVDLRYKLLEVYARAGDEIAFDGEVHFIKSKGIVSMFDPLHQKIAKLRDRYFE